MASRFFSIIALSIAIATSHALASSKAQEEEYTSPPSSANDIHPTTEEESSARRLSRVLTGYNPRAPMTCDNFPRVCRAKGSPGPDCCRKQCVNVMTDNLNCGQCGRRCRYGEACCGGNCVNVMYDPKHCGGCRIKCKKGSLCKYGMCSYA